MQLRACTAGAASCAESKSGPGQPFSDGFSLSKSEGIRPYTEYTPLQAAGGPGGQQVSEDTCGERGGRLLAEAWCAVDMPAPRLLWTTHMGAVGHPSFSAAQLFGCQSLHVDAARR